MCLMNAIRPKPRDSILAAAFEVYSDRPTASLADVAERAGVGRATLHRYFPGRADLMRALAKIALAELETAVEAATQDATSHEEGLRKALFAIVPLATRQWFLSFEGVETDPEIAAGYATSRDALRQSVEAAKAEGVFATDVPTVWIVEVFDTLVFGAWSLVRAGEATPKHAAALAWRTLRTGLGPQDR